MSISIQMTPAEISQTKQKADNFNTYLEQTQKIVSKSELAEADFLKILITQLKTQDPTKPMDDKEFIGQMAQMTSLKQMNRLTDNMVKFTEGFAFTKAVALVDKNVSWIDEAKGLQTGKVESIKVKGGLTLLNIAGTEVTIDQVTEVLGTTQPVQYTPVEVTGAVPDAPKPVSNASVNAEFEIDYPAEDISQSPEGNSKIEAADSSAGTQQ
ncbi:MAG: hypothetical protein A2Y33_09740 [Spirochaetes bacterium GWF1_51_8]|nr:MAG: hypothetical protein A2Y33_09740 [Spirochaetes bacterium GWF1_51_8]